MTTGQIWDFNQRKKMKNLLIASVFVLFSSAAFAGSCPMLAGKVATKIETAKKLHDQGMAAHKSGDHAKSEELLKKALGLFKG